MGEAHLGDAAPDISPKGADADRLRVGFDDGERAHGPLGLAFDVYAARVTALVRQRLERAGAEPTPAAIVHALERTALGDLYLAIACDERLPAAWEAFVGRFSPRLRALARRRGAREDEADAIARELPGALVAPPALGGARTRMGTFDGSGSLLAWLATIVAYRLVDPHRAPRTEPIEAVLRAEESSARRVAPTADASADPASLAVADESRARFSDALAGAWAHLAPRERLAVGWKYRDGLSQIDIARLLGVGPPRASRILARAVEKLRVGLGSEVRARRGDDDPASWRALERAIEVHLAIAARPPDSLEDGHAGRA